MKKAELALYELRFLQDQSTSAMTSAGLGLGLDLHARFPFMCNMHET
jgi:hypothetical protein